MLLVDLTVDYDNHVTGDWGMVLKFSDLEGRESAFTSLNTFRGLLGFGTWAGQTKFRYERPVTDRLADFADREGICLVSCGPRGLDEFSEIQPL